MEGQDTEGNEGTEMPVEGMRVPPQESACMTTNPLGGLLCP
jgi:hypothetical protein